MACSSKPEVKCDPRVEGGDDKSCGTSFAFPYFISFYVLCSFLVSDLLNQQYLRISYLYDSV